MSVGTELQLIPEITNPGEIFVAGGLDPILQEIETKVRAYDLDISTDRGRKEIASLARKIASSKTFIDDAGKFLVSDWKEKSKAVDAERKRARDFLDSLKEEIRRPLTEWEQRDERRIAAHEAALTAMAELNDLLTDGTIEQIKANHVRLLEFGSRDWEEFADRAKKVYRNVDHWLEVKLERAIKAKQDAEELARLRREAVEREQREREERIAKEAAERARKEAEGKAAREALEAERKAAQEKLIAEHARREAEERARKAEEDRLESERQAKEAAENARLQAEHEAKKREREAVERERLRIEAERKAEEEETARRKADQENRQRINKQAADVIEELLVNNPGHGCAEMAMDIVIAIADDQVPNITINY